MWEMFESDYDLECDNDCGPGPPPIFNLPPPPRPDFLSDLDKCSENSLSYLEMCEAIPVSWNTLMHFKFALMHSKYIFEGIRNVDAFDEWIYHCTT